MKELALESVAATMHKLIFIIFTGLFYVEGISHGYFISIKEAPYYISITSNDQSFCGGSIISEYWIVTAGHCMDPSLIVDATIRTGVSSDRKYGVTHKIDKIFVHGDYQDESVNYDIALIKLREPIIFNEFQQPIKLRSKPPTVGEKVILTGLGSQGNAAGETTVLKQVAISVTEQYTCSPTPGIYEIDIFCAGGNGLDACPGDSGGPAVIDNQLAGLVSYGPACRYRPAEDSGAYQRVDLHLDWIFKLTGVQGD